MRLSPPPSVHPSSALSSRKQGSFATFILTCGIPMTRCQTGQESLQKKSLKEVMQSLPVREAAVHSFLESIKPTVNFEVEHIPNAYGPSITDPTFTAIVVSEETRAGGDACNKKRGAAGMPSMAVVGVDVIDGDADDVVATGGKETKVSSSGQRKKTLGKFVGSDAGWFRKTDGNELPYCIGITGGIASGKSSAAKYLKSCGAHVIDCDHLGWASYRKGAPAYSPLVAAFGEGILNPEDGEVDRRKLGPVVFAAPGNLEKLNGIVWPVIQDMAVAEMKRLKAEQGVQICVMEAAVLFEAGWQGVTDEVWTVFCSRPEAKSRLMERNKLSDEDAEKRIAAQLTNEERVSQSNVVICSEWTVERTQEQLVAAWEGAQARSAAVLTDAAEGTLAYRWNAATTELVAAGSDGAGTAASIKSQQWWRKVRDAYTDQYRHYHTLSHLATMFTHLDEHKAELKSPALVAMAIFFHDIVYSEANVGIHAKNEMESAALWREFAADVGLSADQADEVASWIERTASHLKGKAEGDLAFFLDFDLAVLGESAAKYAEYTQQIRMEYASVPLKTFRQKRGGFMPQFLANEALYFTEHFKARYETQARQNVHDEINRLSSYSSRIDGGAGMSNL